MTTVPIFPSAAPDPAPPPPVEKIPSADEAFGPPTADEAFGPETKPASDAPPDVSPGLLTRLYNGVKVFDDVHDRFFKAMTQGGKEGFGTAPLGLSPEHAQELRDIGVFNDPAKGQASPLRFMNEALIRPTFVLTDAVSRAIQATIGAGSAGLGSLTASATGSEAEGERAKREAANFANYLLLTEGGGNGVVSRTELSPLGVPHDVPIGSLPKPEDFTAAATVAGDKAVAPALKQLYHDKGILPAEVAHDMQSDVTITQDLLTHEPVAAYGMKAAEEPSTDLVPAGAGGPPEKPPSEPPAEPAPPEEPKALPPPEGSLEDAQQKILSKINVGEHDPKQPMSFDRLYTMMVDDLNPVKTATRDALDEIGKGPLPVADDPYSLFRLTRGQFGKADQWLVNAPFDFKTYANNGAPLKAILAPVEDIPDGLNQFRAYVASKRALELEGRGITSGMDTDAARTITGDKAQNKMFAEAHRGLVDYQNKLTAYMRDAGVLSPDAYDAMLTANKEYLPFFRYMDPTLARAGRRGTGKALSSRNPVKEITGGENAIIDPIESVIKNTYTYIALAEKNAAGLKLVDLLKEADQGATYTTPLTPFGTPKKGAEPQLPAIGGEVLPRIASEWEAADKALPAPPKQKALIEHVTEKPKDFTDAEFSEVLQEHGIHSDDLNAVVTTASRVPEGQTITVFRDGVRETYKVNDPDLLAAWRGQDAQTATLMQKILAIPAKALRAGATLTPDFMARNIIRDFVSAVVNTKGGIFSPIDTARGLAGIVRKDADYQNWLKSGGANAAMVSMDRRYLQENLFTLNQKTGVMDRAWNVVRHPITGLRMMSEMVENSTRLGEFKKLAGGATEKATIQAAGLSSREVTLDFARIGAQMRSYNLITAFANAQVQGIDRLARAFKENPISTSAKIALGVTAPSVLLWWANHDDPRWKEIPSWQKDMFWIVLTKDHIWRIPKPFETGVVFGSGVERSLDAYFDANSHAYNNFATSVIQMLTPSVVPTALQPIAEQWANKSALTGNPIIPDRLEQQLPEYRYTPYTTQLARSLGRIVGAFPGVRSAATDPNSAANGIATALTTPVLLENYVRDWTGGLGVYALQLSDAALRKAGVEPDPPQPLSTLADIPFVRAFVVRYPAASAQSIQDFYDRNAQNKMVMTTMVAQAKGGDPEAAQHIMELYKPRAVLDGVQKSLGEMAQLVRNVNSNPQMSPADKRQLIDTLYMSMITAAQTGNKMLDQAEAALSK